MDALKVEFRAWKPSIAEWFRRRSLKLQPAWSKVRNFREFKVKDKVQMLHLLPKGERRWHDAVVEKVVEKER